MMPTMAELIAANAWESVLYQNADGSPQRWRRNGKTRFWKTRPDDFVIPIKRGLYEHGYIDQDNALSFRVAC